MTTIIRGMNLFLIGALAATLVLLLMLVLHAQTTATQVEIVPTEPTASDSISIKLSGTWPNGCVPKNPQLSVSGQSIRIDTSNPGEICTDALTPWSLTVLVGRLAASSYEVVVNYSSPSQKSFEVVRKTFSVKAADQAAAQELILPIVVNGTTDKTTHYQTTFTILNLSSSTVEAKLQIYDQKGAPGGVFCSPLAPPPSTATALLNANGEFHNSTSANLPILNGWARLTWDKPVTVHAASEVTFVGAPPAPCLLICNRPSTEIIASARVLAVKAAKEFRVAASITHNRHTALALVNPSASDSANIQATLFGPSGEVLKTFSGYHVPPQGRLTEYTWNLVECNFCFVPPQPPPDMFHGTLQIISDIPIAVGALDVLFPEGKFVGVPAVAP
ncbi:MAG TPA: hypothetical protein VGL91_00095 [Acidobacteriota bacterium]|jgi:hypothetical protein